MFNKELLYNIRQAQNFLYRYYISCVYKTNWVGNYYDIDSWLDREVIEK